MIQKVFLAVFDMSIVASVVILAILLVRLFLRRAPKIYSYILWGVVLFRLLCPFSFESAFSIIPERAQNIPQDMALETFEYVLPIHVLDATQRAVGDTLNGGLDTVWVRLDSEDVGHRGIAQASHLQVWLLFAGVLWPIGIVGMVGYSAVSFIKLRRKLVGAVKLDALQESSSVGEASADRMQAAANQPAELEKGSNIYLADCISSPFVMGILQPKIYLPSSLQESEREYIILHERHHIRRGDYIVKLLAFVALCIHWFNPLVWVAFVQAGKDMEMSCDEAVIKSLGEQIRASYSASLLKLALGKPNFAGTPLAFGEGDTKGRINNLAKWKKPKVWVSMVAVILCIIVAVAQFLDIYENSFEYGVQVIDNLEEGEDLTSSIAEMIWEVKLELVSKENSFTPGTSYVTYACTYMNALSSTLSNGDDGRRYLIGDDNLTVINRNTGKETVYDSITWQWQPFPWSDEEWCELYFPGLLNEYAISEYYEEMLYQPISEGYCMLWMDGELWLLDLNKAPQTEPYIWSIYLLMPENWKNISPSISINGDATKYLGMTYQQFQEINQTDAIHYHANFYLMKKKSVLLPMCGCP